MAMKSIKFSQTLKPATTAMTNPSGAAFLKGTPHFQSISHVLNSLSSAGLCNETATYFDVSILIALYYCLLS